jgi:outer membrane lipopolysaccharide assembly protein LptE/RlpB
MNKLAALLLVAMTSSGCGYALAGRGSFLPAYIRVVGIPPLENRTTVSQVEQVLTEKVRTEFIGRGKYTVVPTATGAHAVLSASITSITLQPVGFTEQQLGSRYLFTLTMRVEFTDATTNEVLWSNDSLTFRDEYDLSTRGSTALDGAVLLDQERTAFERISTDVARTVVSAILEAF